MIIAGLDVSINSTGIVKIWLNEKFEQEKIDWFGFTDKKKNYNLYNKNLHLYDPKKFTDYIDKTIFMVDSIIEKIDDCEYVAIENYSFGSKGKSFHIGGFTEILKMCLYINNKKIRLYDIAQIKKWAGCSSNCTKDKIINKFEQISGQLIPSLHGLDLPKSPACDIIDAFYIANILCTELKLRTGFADLKSLTQDQIWICNYTSKSNPENILCRPFLQNLKKKPSRFMEINMTIQK